MGGRGRGAGGAGGLLLVLDAQRGAGHLGGIEETRTVWTRDGAQEYALRDTRDEVA